MAEAEDSVKDSVEEVGKDERKIGHPEGACFLVYEPHSTGRLLTYYSKENVDQAISIWTPGEGKNIPKYKYKQNFGRIELIRGCSGGLAGRKAYMSGWCQYIRLAKLSEGTITKFDLEYDDIGGIEVDVYGYRKTDNEIVFLQNGVAEDVTYWDAVAVIPHNSDVFEDLGSIDQLRFLVVTQQIGFSTSLEYF